MKGNKKEIN